jgi:hypothetical protein
VEGLAVGEVVAITKFTIASKTATITKCFSLMAPVYF